MPNLVVYVPQALWTRIVELGLDDPKVEARRVAVGALEEMVRKPPTDRIQASTRLVTPQGRAAAEKEWTGKTDLIEHFPQPASRGACPMKPPRGTKCKVCGKVHPL